MENAAGIRFVLKYGFTVFLIIMGIFGLFKFGFFDAFFSSEKCYIEDSFECIGFGASSEGVNLILRNLHDYPVSVSRISFRDCVFNNRNELNSGISRTFFLKDCFLKGKVKDTLNVDFYTPDNVLHSINGSLIVKVK
jgi:hypothetical protein